MKESKLPQFYGEAPQHSESWLYPEQMSVGTIAITVEQTMVITYRNDSWQWVDRKKPWLGFELVDGKWNQCEKLTPMRELIIVAKDTEENREALKKSIRTKRGDSPSNVRLTLYAMVANPKFKKKWKLLELDPDEGVEQKIGAQINNTI